MHDDDICRDRRRETRILVGPKMAYVLNPVHQHARWCIGRDASYTIRLSDTRISRAHALIEFMVGSGFRQSMYVITDLNSTNGVLVNGEPIERPTVICIGDTIEFAPDLVFTVWGQKFRKGGTKLVPVREMDLYDPDS